MSSQQQGDVLIVVPTLLDTIGAEALQPTLELVNGVITMTAGFETATILSLFGGNYEDDGTPDNRKTYWGNLLETEPARKYVSRTQFILQSLPLTSENLVLLDEAAAFDLQWFLDLEIANSVEIESSIPAVNRVTIGVEITALGFETQFTFTENWKAAEA